MSYPCNNYFYKKQKSINDFVTDWNTALCNFTYPTIGEKFTNYGMCSFTCVCGSYVWCWLAKQVKFSVNIKKEEIQYSWNKKLTNRNQLEYHNFNPFSKVNNWNIRKQYTSSNEIKPTLNELPYLHKDTYMYVLVCSINCPNLMNAFKKYIDSITRQKSYNKTTRAEKSEEHVRQYNVDVKNNNKKYFESKAKQDRYLKNTFKEQRESIDCEICETVIFTFIGYKNINTNKLIKWRNLDSDNWIFGNPFRYWKIKYRIKDEPVCKKCYLKY